VLSKPGVEAQLPFLQHHSGIYEYTQNTLQAVGFRSIQGGIETGLDSTAYLLKLATIIAGDIRVASAELSELKSVNEIYAACPAYHLRSI